MSGSAGAIPAYRITRLSPAEIAADQLLLGLYNRTRNPPMEVQNIQSNVRTAINSHTNPLSVLGTPLFMGDWVIWVERFWVGSEGNIPAFSVQVEHLSLVEVKEVA